MQMNVILLRPNTAPLANLDRHGAADDIARGQVLRIRRVALHESLTARIGQKPTLAAHAFGDQASGAIDAGGMKLHELHVLQWQARTQHHAAAIAGARVRRGAREVGPSVAAGREDRRVRAEAVEFAFGHVERHDAAARAIFHDEIDREVLDEEDRTMPDRLLIQGVQHRMARAVGRGTGALRHPLAEVGGHATEGTLIDASILGARKRHAIVLELDDRARSLLAHELDGILIAEPVGALDRVVEMKAPVVLPHVAERRADPALCRDGVAARRKYFA